MPERPKILVWKGISARPRNESIQAVTQVLQDSEAILLEARSFSDLGLSMRIEVPENQVQPLFRALAEVVRVEVKDGEVSPSRRKQDILILFHLSFSRGTGQLSQEIPEVPG